MTRAPLIPNKIAFISNAFRSVISIAISNEPSVKKSIHDLKGFIEIPKPTKPNRLTSLIQRIENSQPYQSIRKKPIISIAVLLMMLMIFFFPILGLMLFLPAFFLGLPLTYIGSKKDNMAMMIIGGIFLSPLLVTTLIAAVLWGGVVLIAAGLSASGAAVVALGSMVVDGVLSLYDQIMINKRLPTYPPSPSPVPLAPHATPTPTDGSSNLALQNSGVFSATDGSSKRGSSDLGQEPEETQLGVVVPEEPRPSVPPLNLTGLRELFDKTPPPRL